MKKINKLKFEKFYKFQTRVCNFQSAESAAQTETPDEGVKETTESKPEKAKDHSDQRVSTIERQKEEREAQMFLPEVSQNLSCIEVTPSQQPQKDGNIVEHEFKTKDGTVSGKIEVPEKFDEGKKTTIVFRFTDEPIDPEKQKKFLDDLSKQKEKLGNTIVVSMKAPDGATVDVDKQKIDTMRAIIADVEALQQRSESGKKAARALSVLYFADQSQAKKAAEFLVKARTNAKLEKKDRRILKSENLFIAEHFDSEIEMALREITRPLREVEFDSDESTSQKKSSSQSSTIHTGSESGSYSSTPNYPSTREAEVTGQTEEVLGKIEASIETEPLEGKTGLFGDSIINGFTSASSDFNLRDGWVKLAKGGETSAWLLNQIKKAPASFFDGMKNSVVLIGTNDIGSDDNAEIIIARIRQIHDLLSSKGIKVFACTIPPFKGHTYSTYRTKFDEVNKKRISINNAIISDCNSKGLRLIPLHETESNGGLASDSDSDSIADNFRRKGDYVHPKQKELGSLIERYLHGASEQSSSAEIARIDTKKLTPTRYSPELGKWTAKQNQRLIEEGRSPGYMEYAKFDGKPVVLKFTTHTKQEATGKIGRFQATEVYDLDTGTASA